MAQKHFICWPKQDKPSSRSGEIDFPSWLQLLQSHIAKSLDTGRSTVLEPFLQSLYHSKWRDILERLKEGSCRKRVPVRSWGGSLRWGRKESDHADLARHSKHSMFIYGMKPMINIRHSFSLPSLPFHLVEYFEAVVETTFLVCA